MRHEEFESLCESFENRSDIRVKHIVLHQIGRVVACLADDFIEVELADGQHKSWSRENVTLLH
ncbi:MAG: hypothetical protein R2940_02285 [Syntrophotaleaceae bacterium]